MEAISVLSASTILLFFVACYAKKMKDKWSIFMVLTFTYFKFIIIIFNEINPFLATKPDANFYFLNGIKFLNSSSIYFDIKSYLEHDNGINAIGTLLYSIVNMIMLNIFGEYSFVMAFLNTAIYSITVIIVFCSIINVFKINEFEYSNQGKIILLLVLFLFPAALSNSLVNLREMFAVLGCTMVICSMAENQHRAFFSPRFYFGFIISILVRPVIIFAFFNIFIIYFLFFIKKNRIQYMILSIIIFLICVVFVKNRILRILSSDVLISMAIERYQNANHAFPINMQYYNLVDLILHIPEKSYCFLFYPFFWKISSYKYLIPTIDSLFNFVICTFLIVRCCTIYKLKKINKKLFNIKKVSFFYFISGLMGIVTYSIMETQFGGAIRHRISFVIFFIIGLFLHEKYIKFKRNYSA